MRIDKQVYNHVDYELKHYIENKKVLKELENDIIGSSPEPPDGQPRGQGAVGNPTESKTIKLMSSVAILRIQQTTSIIERLYSQLSKDKKNFFDLYYTQHKSVNSTCIDANIDRATLYRWRSMIVEYVAKEMGWI